MSQNPSPFSIRPIKPPGDRNPKTIAEFITRVNTTRPGGFRALRQTRRTRDVEADTDVRMDDAVGSEEEADTEPVKDPKTAHDEIARSIVTAHQHAKQVLDLVSLWMSKESPTIAIGTLDPNLRNLVGIGTIGSTKLHEPQFAERTRQQNTVVSTGSKLLAINNTSNKLLAAAARLQSEMDIETKYWRDVIAVKEAGWPVTLQDNSSMLRVKFGFTDSGEKYQARSWAALSREDDGSVKLHLDGLVAEPKWLDVSLEKNGRIIFGRSSLPQQQPSDAPLELRVREARNTILSQELWHEMVREGHSLSGYNVHCSPSSVTYRMDDSTTISFTLAALGDAQQLAGDPQSRSGDAYANTISSALYLLLSYAHRQNAHQRGQVQPLSTSQANLPKRTYYLLRPLIAYLQHEIWVRSSLQFVSDLVAVLRFAGVDAAQYTFEELPLASLVADGASEQFLARLIGQFSFRLIITLTPEVRIEMMGTSKCAPRPNWGIRFTPLPPSPPTQDVPSELAKNPLNDIFPPADNYEQIKWAFEYLLGATTRCLAKHFELRAAEWTAKAPRGNKPPLVWARTLKGTGVRDRDTGRRGVLFEMLRADNDRTENRSTAPSTKGESCVWPAPPTLPAVAGLKMVGDLLDSDGHIIRQERTWTLDDIRKGASTQGERIEDVVQRVLVQAA